MLTRGRDAGFTMVELLMSVTITAILAIAVFRASSTATSGIARDVDVAVSSVQSVRLAQALDYDVAGSADVFLYGADAGVGANPPCTTWQTGDAAAWRDVDASGFVRPLFTLRIPTLDERSSAQFLPTTQVRVGYEIRRTASATRATYSLTRVVCEGSAVRAQELVRLGHTLDPTTSGLTTLRCRTADGGVAVPEPGASTAATAHCVSFAFQLPYAGSRALLRGLAQDPVLDRLTSMVGSP